MIARAAEEKIGLVWDRYEKMQPQCGFGRLGVCCRICHMGPCRIDPFGEGAQQGVCGATADIIVARNLARMVAAGTSAHADHAREVAHAMLQAAENPGSGYAIKNEAKLRERAAEFGVPVEGKSVEQIAAGLARAILGEFGRQEGELVMVGRAPAARQEIWKKRGVTPRGIDREVVQLMNHTAMGVDSDYRSILLQSMRTALANGWGGSMIATDLQDILFGSPTPIRTETNLGVLKADQVNIVIHGHEPVLSEMLVEAARSPEMLARAESVGAKGINLAGICCTGNEILMRHGIPSAGSFLHQELALMTGAVDAMVLDVQCCMPSLSDVSARFHTKLLTTSAKGKRAEAKHVEHIEFAVDHALETAKQIVARGIDNFPNRKSERVQIPQQKVNLIGGFTADFVSTMLGGRFRPSYRPLNNAIIEGRIRGVAGVVGCENPELPQGSCHVALTQELIANDVLVVATGCSALSSARAGLLRPEAALEMAGPGLREVCEAVGMPPVLHLGSCVDNTRILLACCNMLVEGGLGQDISDLPVAGAAPEWMSEKAISIGFYAAGSGIYTVFGTPWPVLGSENVTQWLTDEMEESFGGKFAFEDDPHAAAQLIIAHMDRKREALRLEPMKYQTAAEAVTA
jgi:carbon-monoxide dehydrogenase catalytic subunit